MFQRFPVQLRTRRRAQLSILVSAACLASCRTPEEWREDADREVYALIDARRAELFRAPGGFRIDAPEGALRTRILDGEWSGETPLSLADCLSIAAENSREFRSRRETLYLAALDMTLERYLFTARGFGGPGVRASGTGNDAVEAGADAQLGFSRLFVGGANVVASLGASLFRFVSTGDGWEALSNLSLAFTQPLLRGSGRLIVRENLTQAERTLVYEVRAFERFRRTFAIEVAQRVYDLLEANEQLANQRRNYQSLVSLRERNKSLAEAGRLSDIQVDQARQDELRSENQILAQQADLQRRIDDFKLFLGLPIEVSIQLDRGEFQRLIAEDPYLGQLEQELAIGIARGERLDFLNTRGRYEDRTRKVQLAENDLLSDLGLNVSLNSLSDDGRPLSYSEGRTTWSAGLDLDLPLDRLAERNALRRRLIDLEVARREVERVSDQIGADVRDSLRRAEATRQSHAIQVGAVQLGERRVASAELNLQAGRASTRDLLEAQDDLLEARNAAISALIDFTLARLNLYLDLEMLRVDDSGLAVSPALAERLAEEHP